MMFVSRAKIQALSDEIASLRQENGTLKDEVERLKPLVAPDIQELYRVRTERSSLEHACEQSASELHDLYESKKTLETELEGLNTAIDAAKARAKGIEEQIDTFEEEVLVQEFGLYQPRFEFANSLAYKKALVDVRALQKKAIANFNLSFESTNWTVNNSAAQGKRMVRSVAKLLMRAYNSECDDIVRKVKYSNIDTSLTQIQKRADTISNYGKVLHISIPASYVELKVREAQLAFEWAIEKEKEKEEVREERERRREEAKLKREIEAERRKLTKERKHYLQAYKDITSRLRTATDDEKPDLEQRAAEIQERLSDVDKAFEDIDYREANQRAGFVYVISNIGSFGDNVYKIGMTRRLDPFERVRELSDASVPFNFDVHAMIFCDDAPALEAALHREFEDRKINLVNKRREFFACRLEEIEDVVRRNYDKTVEFISVPDAEQFRISREMRQRTGGTLPTDSTVRGGRLDQPKEQMNDA